jgi:hypothetical protein
MTELTEALRYHRLGLSVIPFLRKQGERRPAIPKWQNYQTKMPTEDEIRQWFSYEKPRNVAIVCGSVSGGLVVRDFDEMQAYERWAAAYSTLARTLPTVITKRGRHVYFRTDLGKIQQASGSSSTILDMGDGELRAGGVVIAPPSLHHIDRTLYRWQVPLGREIPFVDVQETGLLVRAEVCTERTDERRERQREQTKTEENGREQTKTDARGRGREEKLLGVEIEQAINGSLPSRPGQRHRQVFELVRALKGIPDLRQSAVRDLKPIVREWHKRALPVIATKSFDETWSDFINGWGKVKYPKGVDSLQEAYKKALSKPDPPEAAEFDAPEIRLLIKICRELQLALGQEPFFLASRKAGQLLGSDHTTASRWLRLLVVEGLLEIAKIGGPSTMKATRYYYRGQLE